MDSQSGRGSSDSNRKSSLLQSLIENPTENERKVVDSRGTVFDMRPDLSKR